MARIGWHAASILCIPLAVFGVLETGFVVGLIATRIAMGIKEGEVIFFGDPAGPLWGDLVRLGLCVLIATASIGLRRFSKRRLSMQKAGN